MTFLLDTIEVDPIELASQGNAILGIRGSGKSYTATYLAEQYHLARIPFIAFDPIGVWRFLRVPDKGPGTPVVVAGGVDGDLPLTPESAPEIVRAAMRSGVSLIIDLYSMELSKADWRRIVRDCVRVLLYENGQYGLRHVFIEEAAEFIPQKVIDGLVYAEVEKLARMGGNARLGYTLINQRAEEVSKAVLELCDNLFLHRQKGKNSLTSLAKWLDVANVKPPRQITDSLPMMPAGQCWMWLAGTERPIRVTVPVKNSFHPDRTVMHGSALPAARASVDVGEFVQRMKAVLAEPVDEKKKTAKPAPIPAQASADAEARGRASGYAAGKEAGREEIGTRVRGHLKAIQDAAEEALNSLGGDLHRPPLRNAVEAFDELPTPTIPIEAPAAARVRPARRPPSGMPGASAKLLSVIDTNPPVARTWGQFAALAGIKARGGHFLTGKRHLIDTGLVHETGGLVSIAKPSADAKRPSVDPAANVDMWANVLTACAPQILRFLFGAGGSATKDRISTALNLQPRGGHWLTGWKQLRDNDIVTLDGETATLTKLFHPKKPRATAA